MTKVTALASCDTNGQLIYQQSAEITEALKAYAGRTVIVTVTLLSPVNRKTEAA